MSDLVRVSISDLAVRGALISVLRPLIYSLNPSGDIISGNQNAAYVKKNRYPSFGPSVLTHLTASYLSQPEARVIGWLALASHLAVFTIALRRSV
jgi:hypothetical protein